MAAAASHTMSLNSLLRLENCVDAVADMLQAEGRLDMKRQNSKAATCVLERAKWLKTANTFAMPGVCF